MHIYVRLKAQFRVSICPGVTGMSGCWTAAGEPIAWGDDVLTVLPGTLPREALIDRLVTTDAAVIMKLGRNFAKVKAALAETGLLMRAIYVERGAMTDQKIMPLIEKSDDEAPYFSMIIVPGQGRRP
jgi:precorrin-2/cobalt-factor-2 C20-methyltransferase